MDYAKIFSRLSTPAEVAREVGCNPRTISRWADEGALVCVRFREVRLIDVAASRRELQKRARKFLRNGGPCDDR